MNTISVILNALQQLINALIPAISAVEHIAQTADLYSNTIHNEARIANAKSTKSYHEVLEEMELDQDLNPIPKAK